MANTSAPFGFQYIGTVNGPPNFAIQNRRISATNTTAVFFGDAVQPVVGTSNGFIKQAAANTLALAGIFVGCQYFSTAQRKLLNSKFWPGSDATGDVIAFIISDPTALFQVQAGTTAVGFSAIGQNIALNVGTGSTVTQQSGMFVESPNTGATLPFIVVDVVRDPPGVNGADPLTAFNFVKVAFNSEIFKAGVAAVA